MTGKPCPECGSTHQNPLFHVPCRNRKRPLALQSLLRDVFIDTSMEAAQHRNAYRRESVHDDHATAREVLAVRWDRAFKILYSEVSDEEWAEAQTTVQKYGQALPWASALSEVVADALMRNASAAQYQKWISESDSIAQLDRTLEDARRSLRGSPHLADIERHATEQRVKLASLRVAGVGV